MSHFVTSYLWQDVRITKLIQSFWVRKWANLSQSIRVQTSGLLHELAINTKKYMHEENKFRQQLNIEC